MTILLHLSIVFLLSACSLILQPDQLVTDDPNAQFSRVRVSSLGPGQYMVSCVDGPSHCAAQANRLCPAGLDVVSNTTNAVDYGRMTMIIKCHEAPAAPAP
jgi:hypothetical protein